MECEIPLWIPVTFTDVNSVREVVILSGKERQNRPHIEMFSGRSVTDHIVKGPMNKCRLRELPVKGNEMFSPS
jgi:hypothetical protein